MVLLKSCCCWQSVRSGSFASGIYSIIFYSVMVTAGSFHVHTIVNLPEPVPVLLTFSVMMLAFAALSVMAGVVLLVGLCTNNRILLLPWLLCIAMATVLDIILSLYLVSDTEIDPFFAVLVATDIIICALNVYCILCVTSQYQEYASAGGRPRQVLDVEAGPPIIHFEPASTVRVGNHSQSSSQRVSVSFIQNSSASSPTSSSRRPLLSSGSSGGRTAGSSGFITSSSPVLMLRRSSFSSTSEISFCSSDLLPGSRRGSMLPPQDRQGLSPVGESKVFPDFDDEASVTESVIQTMKKNSGSPLSQSTATLKPGPVFSRFRVTGFLPATVSYKIPANSGKFEGDAADIDSFGGDPENPSQEPNSKE
ncbi:uncharacterized protein LOC129218229 isoform X1 [Uloborus diversus]|uniref:uncharacterized protein LOC129218229 isoform X1 n=1 Tax=Uloborus diversus TaxID=327109 RepID=UPI00240A6E83|nr:uncharacterized protein LOC129218229 isoform X1 [Uloborus diversus]